MSFGHIIHFESQIFVKIKRITSVKVLISEYLQSNKTANKNYKTAKSNTTVVQQGVPYHNYRNEKTKCEVINMISWTQISDEQNSYTDQDIPFEF